MGWIEIHSTFVGIVSTTIFFFIGHLILRNKEFLDNKPYISVNPRFERRPLPDTSGYIRWIEIGNYGKSVAEDVVIEFLYDGMSISSRYEMKYLPPSPNRKYHRPYVIYSISEDAYPEEVKISYRFRGEPKSDRYTLVSKDRESRGYELEEYVDMANAFCSGIKDKS